jgi:hypothetical protein
MALVPLNLWEITCMLQYKKLLLTILILHLCYTLDAEAADLEQTLRNLVTAFTSRILPILALGYLAKNIFAHIQGDPNAKNETVRVVVAIACLVGLAGVWSFITSQVR